MSPFNITNQKQQVVFSQVPSTKTNGDFNTPENDLGDSRRIWLQ